jgi:hypothetical protein
MINNDMKGRPAWLDREQCFKLWLQLGTIRRVRAYLEANGVVNPTTGERPSEIGVRASAWKWALYHPEEARQIFIEKLGIYTDDQLDYWFDRLERAAKGFLATRVERYKSWEDDFNKYKSRMQLLS